MENFLKLQLALGGAFQKHLQSLLFCNITISDHPLLIEQVELVKTSVTDQFLWCVTTSKCWTLRAIECNMLQVCQIPTIMNMWNNGKHWTRMNTAHKILVVSK
jgi:hypothetical protein